MEDASAKFETTVHSALQLAQDELISDGIESSQTNEAFRELKMLTSVSKRRFGGIRQQHKHVLLAAFPMLTSISNRWYKTFMLRTIPRCGVKKSMESYCFEKSQQGSIWHRSTNCYQSSYGVSTHSTSKRITMVFTRETKVRGLFCEIMDC